MVKTLCTIMVSPLLTPTGRTKLPCNCVIVLRQDQSSQEEVEPKTPALYFHIGGFCVIKACAALLAIACFLLHDVRLPVLYLFRRQENLPALSMVPSPAFA